MTTRSAHGEISCAARGAVRTGEVERAQVRGEARGLAQPVGDEAGGADDERGARLLGGRAQPRAEGERLERLAEAHVVGETQAVPAASARGRPAISTPGHLVGTQLRDERGIEVRADVGRRLFRGIVAAGP